MTVQLLVWNFKNVLQKTHKTNKSYQLNAFLNKYVLRSFLNCSHVTSFLISLGRSFCLFLVNGNLSKVESSVHWMKKLKLKKDLTQNEFQLSQVSLICSRELQYLVLPSNNATICSISDIMWYKLPKYLHNLGSLQHNSVTTPRLVVVVIQCLFPGKLIRVFLKSRM